ncbi:hypothetical protein SSABA_v1c04880 [Spiroplasma sabaudiense Ar-1343]|uniref:Uncharacterized protein n=1 Tax=Spiroplasma sabaudiense Ar-1343 TaxID=1276257 RepID=W6AAL6_9MOLU|nr:hypothetical protein [Spiroplasma sabaudiense]AHI53895.1 hypothetical protein SSABA_v1c04880 [Spiroplasma sabaudiense Ar-1343]
MNEKDFFKNKILKDPLLDSKNFLIENIVNDVNELKRLLHIKNKTRNKKSIPISNSENDLVSELENFNLNKYGNKYKNPKGVENWQSEKKELEFSSKEEQEEYEFQELGIIRLKLNRKLAGKTRNIIKKIEDFTQEFENNYGAQFLKRVAEWIDEEEKLYENS